MGSNKIIGYEITNVSFSGWRMIIDLVGTDARETNWPGLPFTDIEDQYFLVNGTDARRFASAGQQRTIVLALKLAELELIKTVHGQSPILLLDDVLAELDPKRQLLLLDAVGQKHQCLISATHLESFEGEWVRNSQLMQLDSFS